MKRFHILFLASGLLSLMLSVSTTTAQPVADEDGDVVVGTNIVDPSALLDLVANNKGMLVPRMTTVQRNAIVNPAEGLMVYNTDDFNFNVWSSASGVPQWDALLTNGNHLGWLTNGNINLIDGANNFLGTTDATPVRIVTNNVEHMIVEADGDIGINTTTPDAQVHIVNDLGQIGLHVVQDGDNPAIQIDESDFQAGILINEANTGPGIRIFENDGGPGIMITEAGSQEGLRIEENDDGDGAFIGELNDGSGLVILEDNGGAGAVITESAAGAGIVLTESNAGHAININESDAGDGIVITENGIGNGVTITQNGGGVGLEVINNGGGNAITATGNIDPGANNTYNLGSTLARWDEIYVNGLASIHLGVNGDEAHITYNDVTDLFGLDFNADNNPEFTVDDNGNISIAGTINANYTTGSVLFAGPTGIAQDNANFFYDDANNRLRVTSAGGSGLILAMPAAVHGENGAGHGVAGTSSGGASAAGLFGSGDGTDGVWGSVTNGAGRAGVRGLNNDPAGFGVIGESNVGIGVFGTSNANTGVVGQSATGGGIIGSSISGVGVRGSSANGIAVAGFGNTIGVLANATGIGASGLHATAGSLNGIAVNAIANNNGGTAINASAIGINGTAISINASSPSGTGINMASGSAILSYSAVANGGTVPDNTVVAHVGDNGAAASQATVTLPAAGTNGQILIITTADPDGVSIIGGSAPFATTNPHTAIRYIRAGGSWIAEN